jgi:Protein of unknown function (DUF4236)
MGLSYRKSIKAGPFRFNLSGSGVGVSVGVPGFRVGAGPRGHYVSMSAGGFTYRTSLPSGAPSSHHAPSGAQRVNRPPQLVRSDSATVVPMAAIASASVDQLSDSSADALLEEIRRKNAMLPLWPWPLIVVTACVFLSSQSSIGPMPAGFLFPIMGLTALLTVWLYMWDSARRSTVLFYNISGPAEQAFANMLEGFKDLCRCNGRWRVTAQARVLDGRYHAGADDIVRRKSAEFDIGGMGRVKCNVDVPRIKAGDNTFYFCPDRMFIIGSRAVAAVSYSSLQLQARPTQFIETDGVPTDAQVVGHTWRYVNRNGTPDRRFNNNRQIPIAQYEQFSMRAQSGINERFNLSRVGAAARFVKAIDALAMIGAQRRES